MNRIVAKFFASILLIFVLGLVVPITHVSAQYLFGATPTDEHEFIGYMVIENTDGTASLCGINFVSPSVGLTAAHCTEKFKDIFANIGKFAYSYDDTAFDFVTAVNHPSYTGNMTVFNAGINDIAVVKFSNDVVLNEYAGVASPTAGCGYFIVGYGRNEDDLQYDRRIASVCIENITVDRFEVSLGESFFCQGDSGAGIYKSGTNTLVGLVSSLASTTGSCELASNFFAVRADVHEDFLTKNGYSGGSSFTPTDVNPTTPIPSTPTPSPETTPDDSPIGGTQTSQRPETDYSGIILFGVISICCCLILTAIFVVFLMMIFGGKKRRQPMAPPPQQPMQPPTYMPPVAGGVVQ